MKITIEGERTEGKTTVMGIIAFYLKRLGYAVTVDNRMLVESLENVSLLYDEPAREEPREVQIVEENSSEDRWDGRVSAFGLGKIKYQSRQD